MNKPSKTSNPPSQSAESRITNNAPNLGAQGPFYGPVSITQPQPTFSSMPLDQALALLAQLPLDQVPGPQPLPTPHRILYPHNPLFVGREEELRAIISLLLDGKTIAIITGISGMGKTQLAVEIAHRYGAFFGGGVFWVSFADPIGISSEIADCGTQGLITNPNYTSQPQETQIKLVRTAWEEQIPRLLIFDNCEEEQLLRQWLPSTGGCRVLVTSRRARWSATLKVQTVPLEALSQTASINLLQRHQTDLATKEAQAIADELGRLPLALHLAGSFLARYQNIITPSTYIKALRQQNPLNHPSLQGYGIEDMPTDRAPHIDRAFTLSVSQLNLADPIDNLAGRLLARSAHLAPGEPFPSILLGIAINTISTQHQPITIIQRFIHWLKNIHNPKFQVYNPTQVIDALHRLISIGLLEPVGTDMLRLHRLIGIYARQRFKEKDAQATVEQAIIGATGLLNETDLPAPMQPLLAHLRYAVQRAEGREDAATASLLLNLGDYFETVGAYKEALPLYEQALAIRERILGPDHPDTATSLNNLAYLHQDQGNYELAKPLYEHALAIREQVLGDNHVATAATLNNLAGIYQILGDYDKALQLYEKALSIREQLLGSDHPYTSTSLGNLANLYQAMGKYDYALSLLERSLAICEKILGPEHPSTAICLNNLAGVYHHQEKYKIAQSLCERSLAIQEKVFGFDHPKTIETLINLAGILEVQGIHNKAQDIYELALVTCKHVLGENHPTTAVNLGNLAKLYHTQGLLDRAKSLYEQALEIQERIIPDNPTTATTLHNLAQLYQVNGDFERSEQLYKRALAIDERNPGNNQPDTAKCLNNLACLYLEKGAYDQAKYLLERVMVMQEKMPLEVQTAVALSLNNLASLYYKQGLYHQALPLMIKALELHQQELGFDHPTTQSIQTNLYACRASLILGSVPQADTRTQISQTAAQAHAAVTAALKDPTVNRRALATAIEARARWAEAGEQIGSPYLVLAEILRALICKLGVTPDNVDIVN